MEGCQSGGKDPGPQDNGLWVTELAMMLLQEQKCTG